MKITAIILAKNEEKIIEKAIQSVSFCDEVLIIDDNSTDETAAKAREYGASVLTHPLNNNFEGQRNWAMQQAKNELLLFIDADEEVSKELKKEIISLQTTHMAVSYAVPRRDYFWGQEMKYGETGSARTKGIIRLIKKGSGVWTGAVHETFTSGEPIGKLNGFLNHHSHNSLSSFIQDINIYSTLRAGELATQGKQVSNLELCLFPFGKFVYTYFILGGFLDGPAGFVYSFVMSFHSFLVRAKLVTKSYV